MKYLFGIFGIFGIFGLSVFLTGCQCGSNSKSEDPYYTICDEGNCKDTYDYTKDGNCLTYKSFKGDYKTSCGEYRIYYENGAVPKDLKDENADNTILQY